MKTFPSLLIITLTFSSALLSGCADLCNIRDPKTGQNIPGQFVGTVGKIEKRRTLQVPPVPVLVDVETVSCATFDRVVFTFDGTRLPSYRIQYVDKPIRDCGAGNVIPVAGDAWLQVQFSTAQAHTDAGQPTILERNRQLRYPNLKQLVDTCDFEGEVIWVLGLRSPNRFRAIELADPPRVVLDVKR